jgi:hypothetical protein
MPQPLVHPYADLHDAPLYYVNAGTGLAAARNLPSRAARAPSRDGARFPAFSDEEPTEGLP